MLKTFTKFATYALLLTLLCSQIAHAEVKLYRYDGKLPFIRMMLGMMDAMGVIDRVPANRRYGGYGYPSSSWTQSEPYGSRSTSPLWGSPDWGVLPTDRYAWGDSGRYPGAYGGAKPYWSESDLDGWVDEPWETSQWNPGNESLDQTLPQRRLQKQPQVSEKPPLVQNFNFSMSENGPAKQKHDNDSRNELSNRQRTHSPLAKLAQPGMQSARRPTGQSRQSRQPTQQPVPPPVTQQRKRSPLAKKSMQQRKQKPCVTEFCGLKKPNLNGLWVAENGEMLGVKDTRYLWSDGEERYLTGQIKIQNEYLVTNVDNHEKIMRFKYKFSGNHLLTMQADGTIREFVRMSTYQNYNY